MYRIEIRFKFKPASRIYTRVNSWEAVTLENYAFMRIVFTPANFEEPITDYVSMNDILSMRVSVHQESIHDGIAVEEYEMTESETSDGSWNGAPTYPLDNDGGQHE